MMFLPAQLFLQRSLKLQEVVNIWRSQSCTDADLENKSAPARVAYDIEQPAQLTILTIAGLLILEPGLRHPRDDEVRIAYEQPLSRVTIWFNRTAAAALCLDGTEHWMSAECRESVCKMACCMS